ncbi:TonB-dependent siderophore receptor [Variovorax sp. J22R133]|uniref:TonB-dependent receptor n=1 Tax=Variovorax brevis TaxID=3053503 RepID=UPI002577CD58|nr:TonB-dependent siderophore receptor [Variovorax sp. J22R133]MDM0115156.1 TonB-dependent siderophore receptor [Variovorax sp. J22R133]
MARTSRRRVAAQRTAATVRPLSTETASAAAPAAFAAFPLGAMMLAASVSSWAQTPAAPAQGGSLATITVEEQADIQSKDSFQTKKTNIGKGNQDIRDIPQSINVITEKLMEDAKLDTLKDALHYSAGITFAATENGTDQDIRLRGFPVATVGDLLIDGMRDPSQYDRDTFNLDRVEVLRGSASMIFGRGSTGGVINQVTKKPWLADETDLIGTVGSNGFYRTTADLNKRVGEDSALRINAMWNKADNDGAKIDKYGVAPSYSWGIGSRDEFLIGAFYLNVDNVPMSSQRYLQNGTFKDGVAQGTIPDISPGNFYGTQSDYLKGKAAYGNAYWIHRFDDAGELKTQIRSGQFDRSQWSTTGAFCNRIPTTNAAGQQAACPAAGTVNASNLSQGTYVYGLGLAPRKDQYNGTYLQSDYSNAFNWGGMRHNILTGIDASHETADRFGAWGIVGTNYYKGYTTVGNPNDGRTLPVSPVYRPTSDYSANNFGAYLQDLVQVSQDWKILGGVRWDNFKGDFSQITYPNTNTTTPGAIAQSHLSESPWSYRAGVLYQPSPTQSYHFSYSTSFNTAADTYQYVQPKDANTPPEESRNIELGAKLDWLDGKLSTRAALFRTEKYNERTTDSDFANTSYLLSGKRHSQGLEFEMVGRLTPQWEIYVSYAYIPEAKIDKIGSTNANVVGSDVGLTPKHSGATWISYQATPKLRMAGGLRGASQNRPLQGVTGAASTTNYVPGYLVGDAMFEYKFTPDVFAQFNVTNITNRLYGDQLYPGFVIAGQQRTYQATVGVRF